MIMDPCPECNKIGVDVVHRDEENSTLTYKCCYCNWTETRSTDQPIITTKDTIEITTGEDDRMILVIPENVGLGTKKIAPIGNSHHVIIDQRMMNASGVKSGDLVHVLIWRADPKQPKKVEDHE